MKPKGISIVAHRHCSGSISSLDKGVRKYRDTGDCQRARVFSSECFTSLLGLSVADTDVATSGETRAVCWR